MFVALVVSTLSAPLKYWLWLTLEEEPLIKDHELSPKLAEVLSEVFEAFDKDHDGALNNQELSQFIFTTNGSHPPPQFLVQIAQRFGGTEQYWLTKEGFLVNSVSYMTLVIQVLGTNRFFSGILFGANVRWPFRDAEWFVSARLRWTNVTKDDARIDVIQQTRIS